MMNKETVKVYNVTGIMLGLVGLSAFGMAVFEADKVVSMLQFLAGLMLVFWSDMTGPVYQEYTEEMLDGFK